MPLGKIWVNFEGAPAVEFRFLQPHTGWVEFEMAGRACKRERCVRQGKTPDRESRRWLDDGLALSIMDAHRRIASDPIATHDLRGGHRVSAIARALLDDRRTIWPVQRAADLLCNIVCETCKPVDVGVDVALLREGGALQKCASNISSESRHCALDI